MWTKTSETMDRNQIVLEFMKALAPVFAEQGSAIIKQLADAGHDPSKCTADGMDLLHAYAKGVGRSNGRRVSKRKLKQVELWQSLSF